MPKKFSKQEKPKVYWKTLPDGKRVPLISKDAHEFFLQRHEQYMKDHPLPDSYGQPMAIPKKKKPKKELKK